MPRPRPPWPPRHAVISGGSSGIGLAMAQALAAQGSRLTLLARDPVRLEAAAEEIRAASPAAAVLTIPCDMREAEAVAQAVARAEAEAPLDFVVACAGVVKAGTFEALDPAAHRGLMETNYFGVLNLLRPSLAAMRARGAGRSLIVGSAAGLAGLWGYSAYAPTKFALRGLAEALRAECAPDGVRVSIAHPPDVETPQLAAERAERPPELAAIAGTAKARSAEDVAAALLRGARRGRADVPVGLATWALLRLAPAVRPALDVWFDLLASRARRG
ncbi:SDR family NAD(P)-dependent oxidoreductase [Albimonas sp. CAU 1670]|uniref:SDR family NAD(P)-dependent oxidoreductase n=1 Tax=Albimonas sp. CAU 1670 TaxID=3032599 RepID=UPI0023DC15C1|nr:SDR family NAD(P)-dependent oxidoreductase [Albimonas sp. CAU 1670]MDF2233075.1 SDR family NAD(P)-dependent oxidoreductase [Albimonas sp. CAU 1670]